MELLSKEALPQLSKDEFLALFDPSIHDKLQEKILEPGIEGLFVAAEAEITHYPRPSYAVQFGPNSTYKAEDLHLGRLLSLTGGVPHHSITALVLRSEFTFREDSTNPRKSNVAKLPKAVSEKIIADVENDFPPAELGSVATSTMEDGQETRRDWPTLYKKTTGGKTQEWTILVERTPEGYGCIVTKYGLQGGKMQEKRDVVEKGKNPGKKNETSAYAQACSESESEWTKQLERKGYGRDVEASAATRSISPMLAKPYEDIKPEAIDWEHAFGQRKYDGFRCLVTKTDGVVSARSREGKPMLTIPHILEALAPILREGFILDGELYRHEPFEVTLTDEEKAAAEKALAEDPDVFYAAQTAQRFQHLASAVKKLSPLSAQLEYHVYDHLAPLGFFNRYGLLEQIPFAGPVKLAETVRLKSPDELFAFQSECLEVGFEGAMLRHGTAGYHAGKRSPNLLKVKKFKDAEFRVVDVREGRGTHKGMAIFVCKTNPGDVFEATAPGSHDEKRSFWEKREHYIGRMLTVKFFEYTGGENPVPRFPVALRFHETA